jgi:uncharacterized protein (TIGR02265 family)
VAPATYTIDQALTGDLDVEGLARSIPQTYVVKGMFFSRIRGRLRDGGWEALLPTLSAPPRLGYYVPFSDYPQSDYTRVSAAAAVDAYPRVPVREAVRRLARDDFSVFASSTFGKVVLSAVGDVHRALLTVPTVYTKMASGDWEVRGEELAPDTVRLEFVPHYGSWEYQVGQMEGLVLYYGESPETTVSLPSPLHLRLDVHHSGG